jgi:hypothetical protein
VTVGPFASLNGAALQRCKLTLPYAGIWHADVDVADDALPLPAGPQLLVLAGVSYTCAVIRAIDFAGKREVRLVGGTGGWRKSIPAKDYASPAGVPTSVVLADAASAVLEAPPVLDPTVTPTLGPSWERQAGTASLVLWAILSLGWWMDPTGVVQTAPRLPTPITSYFDAVTVQGAPGRVLIATETPGDWTPGRTFVGPTVSGTVNRVTHTAESSSFRTEIMVQP